MSRPTPDNPNQKPPRDPSIDRERDSQPDPNDKNKANPKRDPGQQQKPFDDGETSPGNAPSTPGSPRPR